MGLTPKENKNLVETVRNFAKRGTFTTNQITLHIFQELGYSQTITKKYLRLAIEEQHLYEDKYGYIWLSKEHCMKNDNPINTLSEQEKQIQKKTNEQP